MASSSTAAATDDKSQRQIKVTALCGLVINAERKGYAFSQRVINHLHSLCDEINSAQPKLLDHFCKTLKETAIRLFRQRRYREASVHYQLAARYSPDDPTLVSNQATCMFNLARYEDCIELCVNCMEKFHKLVQDRPVLFFKLTIRLGRANIELENWKDAHGAFLALKTVLANLKREPNRNPSIEEEMRRLLSPFEKHLKAAHDRGYEKLSVSSASSKSEGVDEVSPVAVLQVTDLCPHLCEVGKGPCTHEVVDSTSSNETGSVSAPCASSAQEKSTKDDNTDALGNSREIITPASPSGDHPKQVKKECGEEKLHLNCSDQGENQDEIPCCDCTAGDSCPSSTVIVVAESSSDEVGNGKADVFRPYFDPLALEALAQMGGDSSPGNSSTIGPCSIERLSDLIGDKILNRNGANSSSELSDALADAIQVNLPPDQSLDSRAQSKSEKDTSKSSNLLRNPKSEKLPIASPSQARPSSSKEDGNTSYGFKRGFLDSGPSSTPTSEENDSEGTTSVTPSRVLKESRYPEVCYDSDRGCGVTKLGLVTENTDEEMLHLARDLRPSESKKNDSDILISVVCDVLGKSFVTSRTIDFTRIFGHHATTAGSGKRRRKSCDPDCGTCFARRMWKLRFASFDHDEALDHISKFENDSRHGQGNFPSEEEWQRSGYYGSGYEMAFDEPALIHGVAYICHLQTELHWRGDKVPFLKDIQHSFISSLERHTAQVKDFDFLFELFLLLRETVDFISQFSIPSGYPTEPAVQFDTTAGAAAKSLFATPQCDLTFGPQFFDLILASRSNSLVRNSHNWATLGHFAREEALVYHVLLRDLHHLISKQANIIKEVPMYLEPGKAFCEVFEKACGRGSEDERNWTCRIVSIIARMRCRQIERVGRAARENGHLDYSIKLYSCGIERRPRQARLFYGRAQTRAAQKRWAECLSDVKEARDIVARQPWNTTTESCCPTPEKCILVDIIILEADVLCESAGRECSNKADTLRKALDYYLEAFAMVGSRSELRTELRCKIELASQKYHVLMSQLGTDLSGENSTKKSNTSPSDSNEEISRMTDSGSNVNVPPEAETGSEHTQNKSSTRPKRKRRRSRKRSDKGTTKVPEPLPTTDIQREASSDDDDEENGSLAGNPYAALLGGETPVSLRNATLEPTSRGRGRNIQPPSSGNLRGRQTIEWGATQRAKRAVSVDKGVSRDPASVLPSQLRCDLCNVSFSGIVDHDNHMRGKRHQTALRRRAANGSGAGQAGGVATRATPNAPSDRRMLPGSSSTSQGHARPVPVLTEQTQSRGPNEQEALAEAERAIAILGGEARPCDVVARMNFSKWNVQNVNDYLERHFGGLLALCLPRTDTFKLSPGSESRPVLLLINRVRRAAPRRNNLHRRSTRPAIWQQTPVSNTQRGVENITHVVDDIEFPSLGSNLSQDSSQRLRKILHGLPSVSGWTKIQRKSPAAGSSTDVTALNGAPRSREQDVEVCGICMDSLPDVRCMPCKHEWCETCILDNMKRGRFACPFCMQDVLHLERLSGDLD